MKEQINNSLTPHFVGRINDFHSWDVVSQLTFKAYFRYLQKEQFYMPDKSSIRCNWIQHKFKCTKRNTAPAHSMTNLTISICFNSRVNRNDLFAIRVCDNIFSAFSLGNVWSNKQLRSFRSIPSSPEAFPFPLLNLFLNRHRRNVWESVDYMYTKNINKQSIPASKFPCYSTCVCRRRSSRAHIFMCSWFSNSSLDEQFIFIHTFIVWNLQNTTSQRRICVVPSSLLLCVFLYLACLFLLYVNECVFHSPVPHSVCSCLFRKFEIICSWLLSTGTKRHIERNETKNKTDKTHFTHEKKIVATNRNKKNKKHTHSYTRHN